MMRVTNRLLGSDRLSRARTRLGAGLATLAITSLAAPAAGQCEPEWLGLGSGLGEATWGVTSAVFDDGSGAELYVAGRFQRAGGIAARFVARWDGASWSPVGEGLAQQGAHALAVFDDGSGPALYVAGAFAVLQRWNGAAWETILPDTLAHVLEMAVYDDGSGPALYIAGSFDTIGGIAANNIARWDGTSWSALGAGTDYNILDLQVFDDGSGPALYASGLFQEAGGAPANYIARWDGASWSPLGDGIGGVVRAMTVFDDGSGPALYAAGYGGEVKRWDGSAWSAPLGGTMNDWVDDLTVYDDGSGPALYAAGRFTTVSGLAGSVQHVVRWDGAEWRPLDGGGTNGWIVELTEFDDGRGSRLFALGDFTEAAGIEVNGIASWGCPPTPCLADCDNNRTVDFFDFLCFQNLFAAGDPAADCDESGSLDFADFLCFQDAFAAGCP